ncbi:Acaa1b [Symbiodinium natans]|uniref:Acaa1b protein n=1 Tax=Symbiodinium natans TaxID=878477 RepID=A0A812SMG2_9DINO|nr:Acaa1b [Symbiodinium natans]
MQRLTVLAGHVVSTSAEELLNPSPVASYCGVEKSDEDIVICCAVRTAITKAKKGGFKDTPPEDMLVPLFQEIQKRTGVKPDCIGDIQIGNVMQQGGGALTSRQAQFMAGLPCTAGLSSVNRWCSSGLQAVANIGASIKVGSIDIGLAGGVEQLSFFPMGEGLDLNKFSEHILAVEDAKNCLLPMGITSENVAAKYGISFERQNALGARSNDLAIAAQRNGLFKDEIVPIKTKTIDKKTKAVKEVLVDTDEGPRAGTTVESLGKLKPAFKAGGTTTAGNSSQVSDGAALVLVARRSEAKKHGLPILARLRSFAVAGCDPALMGIGPAVAIPKALEKAGLTVADIDIFEINEAFASQAVVTVDTLKIPLEKVNPKGGAIALGHPLGCTGARQIATLLPEMKRTNAKFGLCSMCIATGQGVFDVVADCSGFYDRSLANWAPTTKHSMKSRAHLGRTQAFHVPSFLALPTSIHDEESPSSATPTFP